MKYSILILLFLSLTVKAQEHLQFTIAGKVTQPFNVTLASLKSYKSVHLDSMVIYSHLQQRKGSLKNINGVLLKDLLSKVKIISESPKKLSEYYIVCTAMDNYKVVYSWNEIFNSETGNHILVLSSFETNSAKTEKGDIALITTSDIATGRRFVKGLIKIDILQVNE
ncbi:molybdopterin-binding protein [Pedobacter sp. UYP1]|uniref:molybdopterin-binding protein n=1 Tax=Pedobacter sp. UYP1 TaxID=1756396 RepID=UPI0033948964